MKTYKEFITELSGGTLARYIVRATGSLRSAAAKHGRNMLQGKTIKLNTKSKLKGTTGNYEKMMNRETGIQRAADKLAGKAEEQRLDNIIRSTVDAGPKNKPFPARDFKKDPYGVNYMKQIKKDYDKRKSEGVKEAKMPVQGLMKLAATVAANNKKRKNALQIQKYIGEDAKTGRMSDDDLAAAHKKISGMDQSMPSNQHMLKRINKEINKRKKVNEETIVEKSNTGPNNPNSDTRVNYRTAFTQDRVLNSTPDEERAAEKRKSTAEMIRQKKRDEIQRKKEAFRKKRKGLMAKGEIKSPDPK